MEHAYLLRAIYLKLCWNILTWQTSILWKCNLDVIMEENKRSRSTIFVFLCDLSFPNCRLLTYHLIFLPSLPSPLAFPFPRMKGYRIIVAFSRILNSNIIYSASRRNVVDEVNGHRCIRCAINIMDVWNNLKWPVSFLDLRSKFVKLGAIVRLDSSFSNNALWETSLAVSPRGY